MKTMLCVSLIAVLTASFAFAQSQVKKQTVSGITNLVTIESTVACAGAVTPGSIAEIKKMGFAAIINLREAGEPNSNLEAEAAAAKTAGINYMHVPFNSSQPTVAAVDQFLKVITSAGVTPAFIHCAGGNRAAAMWFVKRALVDKWETDRAMAEATELGFSSAALKNFMLEYVKSHK